MAAQNRMPSTGINRFVAGSPAESALSTNRRAGRQRRCGREWPARAGDCSDNIASTLRKRRAWLRQSKRAGGQIAAPEGPPVLLGAGMTRPMPIGECSPAGTRPKPITPEQARRMSITGTVLVEYTVHSDGRVGEISMRNNGSPILFDAVEKWLVDCAFSPSLSGTKPIPVKIIQAFVFRTG